MVRMVTEYLDSTAERLPDKVAFLSEKDRLTFAGMRESSRRLATGLLLHGIIRSPIAIFMEKSAACIAAFLGVAYSGNFYTPIDVKMPMPRILKIMEKLSPAAVVTDSEHFAEAQEFAGGAVVLAYEDMQEQMVDETCLAKVARQQIDTDVLYVLFTSGSTGTPKGVIIGHRSVIDYTEWLADTFHFDEHTVFGNQAPFYFDNSILDIYSTICAGATCVLIPEEKFSFPIRLLEYLKERKVNTLFWVPSALCLVVNLKAINKNHVDCLQKVLFCGEVMPNKHLNQWRKEYPDVLFANLYGPTEITDVCAAYIVDRNFKDDEPLPMGKPCRNTDILVLDEKNKLVTKSRCRGELCVRGTSLAYGYWNAPEKTREAFVQNPLQNAYPEVIYRTGDIVEYNERDELVYLCRKDFQIKHMGHRIELGEIEMVTSSLSGVEQNCCLYDEQKGRIILFYVGNIKGADIKAQLRKSLPDYMLPSQIYELDAMPLNLNGKIDRVELKNKLC